MKCINCDTESDYSYRFCPYCGQRLYIDLSRDDLTSEHFLDVMNSIYNLIITNDNKDRDNYYHPISRALINKRYELEYDSLVKGALISFERFTLPLIMEVSQKIIQTRSSNAVTGYSIRVSEELITKEKSIPYLKQNIENAIISFLGEYKEEYIIKNISSQMSIENGRERLAFIFYIQNENKHMKYFLNEAMLDKWYDTIVETNAEHTFNEYKEVFSKIYRIPPKNTIYEDVLNDIVFGYCVRLCETLFPIV